MKAAVVSLSHVSLHEGFSEELSSLYRHSNLGAIRDKVMVEINKVKELSQLT